MHEHLAAIQRKSKQDDGVNNVPGPRELYIGDVIQAAIHNGLRVETVLFPEGIYIDIGTPEDLAKAVRNVGCLVDLS